MNNYTEDYYCKFCQRYLKEHSISYYSIDLCVIYRCEDCHAIFSYNTKTKDTFRWIIQIPKYEIVIDKTQPLFSVVHFDGGNVKVVFPTKSIPNTITPFNAAQKLRTYIIFS